MGESGISKSTSYNIQGHKEGIGAYTLMQESHQARKMNCTKAPGVTILMR